MIVKCLRKIIQQLLLKFCILKKKKYVQLIFQKLIQIVKTNNSINKSKRRKRRMALSYSKKTIYIVKRNDIKTSWSFLFFKLSSSF